MFDRAQSLNQMNRQDLSKILAADLEVDENDEEQIRQKEQRILELGEAYKKEGKAKELADLIKVTRPFLVFLSKAKAAKLVRSLVDLFLDLEAETGIEVQLCKVQATLDLQSGILHAADERDFKTAFSYFYEAFEGFDSVQNARALTALKYMLLCKIMLGQSDDVNQIVSGKLAITYSGRDIDAMKAVAQASHKRSLADFQDALKQYKHELEDDVIVKAHLGTLYDTMLEQNLCRIIEPYARVEVAYIAGQIALPIAQVEKKLSQMILDKKFSGILDQGIGVLIVFEETPVDKTYETALETIQHMGKVVDTLYQKAKKLT